MVKLGLFSSNLGTVAGKICDERINDILYFALLFEVGLIILPAWFFADLLVI